MIPSLVPFLLILVLFLISHSVSVNAADWCAAEEANFACSRVPRDVNGRPIENNPFLPGFNPVLPIIFRGNEPILLQPTIRYNFNRAAGIFLMENSSLQLIPPPGQESSNPIFYFSSNLFLCDQSQFIVQDSVWVWDVCAAFQYLIVAAGQSTITISGVQSIARSPECDPLKPTNLGLIMMRDRSKIRIAPSTRYWYGLLSLAYLNGGLAGGFSEPLQMGSTDSATMEIINMYTIAETYGGGKTNILFQNVSNIDFFFQLCPNATAIIPSLPDVCLLENPPPSTPGPWPPACFSPQHPYTNFQVSPTNGPTPYTLNFTQTRIFSWAFSVYENTNFTGPSTIGYFANLAIGLNFRCLTGVVNCRYPVLLRRSNPDGSGSPFEMRGVDKFASFTLAPSSKIYAFHVWPDRSIGAAAPGSVQVDLMPRSIVGDILMGTENIRVTGSSIVAGAGGSIQFANAGNWGSFTDSSLIGGTRLMGQAYFEMSNSSIKDPVAISGTVLSVESQFTGGALWDEAISTTAVYSIAFADPPSTVYFITPVIRLIQIPVFYACCDGSSTSNRGCNDTAPGAFIGTVTLRNATAASFAAPFAFQISDTIPITKVPGTNVQSLGAALQLPIFADLICQFSGLGVGTWPLWIDLSLKQREIQVGAGVDVRLFPTLSARRRLDFYCPPPATSSSSSVSSTGAASAASSSLRSSSLSSSAIASSSVASSISSSMRSSSVGSSSLPSSSAVGSSAASSSLSSSSALASASSTALSSTASGASSTQSSSAAPSITSSSAVRSSSSLAASSSPTFSSSLSSSWSSSSSSVIPASSFSLSSMISSSIQTASASLSSAQTSSPASSVSSANSASSAATSATNLASSIVSGGSLSSVPMSSSASSSGISISASSSSSAFLIPSSSLSSSTGDYNVTLPPTEPSSQSALQSLFSGSNLFYIAIPVLGGIGIIAIAIIIYCCRRSKSGDATSTPLKGGLNSSGSSAFSPSHSRSGSSSSILAMSPLHTFKQNTRPSQFNSDLV